MINDYQGTWVMDALELFTDGTWRIVSWAYESLDEALDEAAIGFQEKTFAPFALSYDDGQDRVFMHQFQIFSAAFNFAVGTVCLDHGAPYCPCVMGADHPRQDL